MHGSRQGQVLYLHCLLIIDTLYLSLGIVSSFSDDVSHVCLNTISAFLLCYFSSSSVSHLLLILGNWFSFLVILPLTHPVISWLVNLSSRVMVMVDDEYNVIVSGLFGRWSAW